MECWYCARRITFPVLSGRRQSSCVKEITRSEWIQPVKKIISKLVVVRYLCGLYSVAVHNYEWKARLFWQVWYAYLYTCHVSQWCWLVSARYPLLVSCAVNRKLIPETLVWILGKVLTPPHHHHHVRQV